jgi:AcrR family transcriptional regulator
MDARTTYHHGALPDALLEAGEKILKEQGLAALSLRAIAREAGVSHGAPAHHFHDLAGLLAELAAVGFRRLAACLSAAIRDPATAPRDTNRAYVAFALENPAMFTLMFRDERLDLTRPALWDARRESFGILREVMSSASDAAPLSVAQIGTMAAGWSLPHGFAVLAIDGRLNVLLNLSPPGTTLEQLLDAALARVT